MDTMSIALIEKYFPQADGTVLDKLSKLEGLYADWNARINLISRNDFVHFWERHVLHSLGLVPIFSFPPGSRVVDVGTGGGFPGIPLAIWFPETEFVLNDSIAKKLKVAADVAEKLNLKNVSIRWDRAEKIREKFDFVTGRAVKSIPEFYGFTEHLLKGGKEPCYWYWKGGDFEEELTRIPMHSRTFELSAYFEEPFFETKKIVQLFA
jgi:16S rRNA (guanine527-N7)-methyltransferase